MNLKLISEGLNHDVEFLTETKHGKKNYYIEGIFAQADSVNRNNRIYPSSVLMPEVEKYIETKVKKNLAMGELDHPTDFPVALQNVSHLITEMRIEGSNVYGKARLAETPMGKIAKGLLDTGVQLSVSTRGAGQVRKLSSGVDEMKAFMFSTVDIVSFPSAPDAFVNGINESVEFLVENGLLTKLKAYKITKEDLNESIRDIIAAVKIDTKGII